MMAERPGILFRFELLDALEQLDPSAVGELFLSSMRYGRDGTLPKFQNPALSLVWPFMKSAADRDAESYDTKMAQRRFAVYSREMKRKGEVPLSFDDWKVSVDIENHRPILPIDFDIQGGNQLQTQLQTQLHTHTQEQEQIHDKGANKPPCPPEFGPELQDAFERWLTYKRERREGYKPTGLKALITQLKRKTAQFGEPAVVQLIETAMASGWKGIAFDRLKAGQSQSTDRNRLRTTADYEAGVDFFGGKD